MESRSAPCWPCVEQRDVHGHRTLVLQNEIVVSWESSHYNVYYRRLGKLMPCHCPSWTWFSWSRFTSCVGISGTLLKVALPYLLAPWLSCLALFVWFWFCLFVCIGVCVCVRARACVCVYFSFVLFFKGAGGTLFPLSLIFFNQYH